MGKQWGMYKVLQCYKGLSAYRRVTMLRYLAFLWLHSVATLPTVPHLYLPGHYPVSNKHGHHGHAFQLTHALSVHCAGVFAVGT